MQLEKKPRDEVFQSLYQSTNDLRAIDEILNNLSSEFGEIKTGRIIATEKKFLSLSDTLERANVNLYTLLSIMEGETKENAINVRNALIDGNMLELSVAVNKMKDDAEASGDEVEKMYAKKVGGIVSGIHTMLVNVEYNLSTYSKQEREYMAEKLPYIKEEGAVCFSISVLEQMRNIQKEELQLIVKGTYSEKREEEPILQKETLLDNSSSFKMSR
ncbi:MAG: hypothetical protein IE916_00330 [Epsilonproteobacteria bacterium]|nr:hypothetical protein [Campylobacterota bacterium]